MYILNFQPIKCHLIITIYFFFSHPVFSTSFSISEGISGAVCVYADDLRTRIASLATPHGLPFICYCSTQIGSRQFDV